MTVYDRSNGGAAALTFARELTGKEYIFGGNWPANEGTDCSGLVQFAYAQVGVELPRTTYQQYTVNEVNDRAEASQPGDLLFIKGSDPGPNGEPGHVVMFVSHGEVFEAEETGTLIEQFPFDTDAWEFRTRPALALPEAPPAPAPKPMPPAVGHPRQADIDKAGVVLLENVQQAEEAEHNGRKLYYWSKTHFVVQRNGQPQPEALYANKHWAEKA